MLYDATFMYSVCISAPIGLFGVFETLLILEVPLLSKHIPQLVQVFLQCGANRSYDDELRIMALNALSWTVK